MTHTPGPWGVCNDGDCKCKQVWCDDHPIADVIHGEWGDSYPTIKLEKREGFIGEQAIAYIECLAYGEVSEETAKANARLIAAAPDLLHVLKELMEQINDDAVTAMFHIDLQNRANEYIAKAEGTP